MPGAAKHEGLLAGDHQSDLPGESSTALLPH